MCSYHKHKRKKWQWFQVKCSIRGYHVYQQIWNPSWQRCYCCARRREFSRPPCCSYFRRRHLLYFEAFTMGDLQRAFLFAEKGWSNQIQNSWTMPTKRLTAGLAWGNVCVDSWAPWQPFVFSQVSFQLLWFNFYTHVASHFNLASINSLNVEAILMWLFINVEAVHY